jgi:hypothetical protein
MHLTLKSHGGFKTYCNADYLSDSGEMLYRVDTTTHLSEIKTIVQRKLKMVDLDSDPEYYELATIHWKGCNVHPRLTYQGQEYEEKDLFRKVAWWKW